MDYGSSADGHNKSQSTTPLPPANIEDDMTTMCHTLAESVRPQLECVASRLEAYTNMQSPPQEVSSAGFYNDVDDSLDNNKGSHQNGTSTTCYSDKHHVSVTHDSSCHGGASPQSEYDICGQTSDNRFPWLRDKSTQCDIGMCLPSNIMMSFTPTSSAVMSGEEADQKRTKRSQSHSAM